MLIIQPHWPPSNLVGTHRMRLIANELRSLGWKAVVLTIDERDYEEELVPETTKLVDPEVEVIKIRANRVVRLFGKRLIGDIGLRGWFPLRRAAHQLLSERKFSFIIFSLPSWYISLLGYGLQKKSRVPFGIDYRDPWVYKLSSEERGLNRAFFPPKLAKILEPLALRGVSLVSGVSDGYLQGVRERYSQLSNVPFVTFQMGFRKKDHFIPLKNFQNPFLPEKRTFVYAGAHWPLGQTMFKEFLQALALAKKSGLAGNVQFLFIGTGNTKLPSLTATAAQLKLGDTFREIPERLSYLQVQKILREAHGAIIIGSIEPHYSASKIFQCLVTAKRTLAYFHQTSEGAQILELCNASNYFQPYNPATTEDDRINSLSKCILRFTADESMWQPNLEPLDQFTSKANAVKLVNAIDSLSLTK